ncbi:MAG: response regulator transcription factor [Rhizomicrobium sp.]
MTEHLPSCVYIVDDDRKVLTALSRLLTVTGYHVRTFDSPRAFLAEHDPATPGCALFDVGMAEVDGLALQDILQRDGRSRPIIFITGHDDARTSVRAMKAGAVDYLTKPVQDTELLAAVQNAIDADLKARRDDARVAELRRKLSLLTTREAEVMEQVVRGRLNKQIAFDLGIVEKTVKVHRARVMEKMDVRSVAALVHVAETLGIPVTDQPAPG